MTIGDELRTMISEQLWRWKAAAIFDSVQAEIDALPSRVDGWIAATGWSYLSTTSITVPSGAESIYAKGDKIHIKNNSDTHHYVIGIADTVLTLVGDAVDNSAIGIAQYSHAASPNGFPQAFSYTPTPGGFSANPTVVATYTLIGTRCFLNITSVSNGTSNATSLTFTLPITAKTLTNMNWLNGGNQGTDNGVYQNNVLANIASAGTTVTTQPQGGLANWTNLGSKGASLSINYDI